MEPLSGFDQGLVVGVLIGEGTFGGDGKQPHVTLRMHVRHEALFRWLVARFPRTRLYGPYGHGGRSYYQWMARGVALVEDVLPVLEAAGLSDIDEYAASRLGEMRERYRDYFARFGRVSSLADLGRRWTLSDDQLARLGLVLDTLARDESAPTSVRGARALDTHVADSLSALDLACVQSAQVVADLGSGAGFPGIVLAIALPDASVALVESAAPKCAYLERLRASAGVANARVVRARVEAWPEGIAAHDLVVARALAPLAVLCEYAAPLLAPGGTLVAWKGAVSEAEAAAGERAAQTLALRARGAVRTAPYAGSVAHHLHLFEKVGATPPGFPRRPGMARKRPLGGDR